VPITERGTWCLAVLVLAACSSSPAPPAPPEPSPPGPSQPAPRNDALPTLALQPLVIDDAPVLELVVTGVDMSDAVDPSAPRIFTFARGEARTHAGRYDILWQRDKLVGFPVAGSGMRANPRGSWRAEAVEEGGLYALRFDGGDGARVVARSADPLRVVAASESGRFRLVVFSEGDRLRLARATDDYAVRWRVNDLPAPATARALTDPDGWIDIAWSTDTGIRWLQLEPDHAEGKLPAPTHRPGASIVASCAHEKLWIATDSSLQRAAVDPIDLAKPSSILACDYYSALVRFADGRTQQCSTDSCKDLAIPIPATVGFVDGNLIAVSHHDDVLEIWQAGTQSRFRVDGAVQRVELFDLGGTPVIVVFDADGKSTRWATL
jgi:hypothetical protein